ncbi:MAG TPA: isoprenylcysteine carboxylmethyltransferase family protein [Gaiellaceae bacterium]|nr:isoprenylcysteine carboxylmethyltransferase family protein [Gaiellaceae bacterium]
MTLWRHLAAVLFLPGTVTVVIPALIVSSRDARLAVPYLIVLGLLVIAVGAFLIVDTVRLFVRIGRGTLAPWDPTTQLVVEGPYRRVRNPMISGVVIVLFGESLTFWSTPLILWALSVFAVNAVYLPMVEEPGLRRRFGPDYDRYRAHVPRWLPRLHPWHGEETTS